MAWKNSLKNRREIQNPVTEIKAGPELDLAVGLAIGLSPKDFGYNPSVQDMPCVEYFRGADSGIVSGQIWIWAGGVDFEPFRPSTDLNAAFSAASSVGLWREYGYCKASGQHVISKTVPVASWVNTIAHAETPALAICAAILQLKGETNA